MILPFKDKHAEFAPGIGIQFDIMQDLTDERVDALTDALSTHLQRHGFDENYAPTESGAMCEEMLDIIGEYA